MSLIDAEVNFFWSYFLEALDVNIKLGYSSELVMFLKWYRRLAKKVCDGGLFWKAVPQDFPRLLLKEHSWKIRLLWTGFSVYLLVPGYLEVNGNCPLWDNLVVLETSEASGGVEIGLLKSMSWSAVWQLAIQHSDRIATTFSRGTKQPNLTSWRWLWKN